MSEATADDSVLPLVGVLVTLGIIGGLAWKFASNRGSRRSPRRISARGANQRFSRQLNPVNNRSGTTTEAGLQSSQIGEKHFIGSAVVSEDSAGDPGSGE